MAELVEAVLIAVSVVVVSGFVGGAYRTLGSKGVHE